jgi:hypothetical protein
MHRGMTRLSVVATGLLLVAVIVAFKFGSMVLSGSIPAEPGLKSTANDARTPEMLRRKLHHPMSPVGGFPSVAVHGVRSPILDEEVVLGVELAGKSRAYVMNAMGSPETELLNDTLAGRSIVVTFCSKCHTALIYSREVEGKALTLYPSGELLADNMIMRDSETGSDWVQVTGEAVDGPLKGHRLELIPAVWTDWKTWRERYPDTTLPDLPKVADEYRHHSLYSAFRPENEFFSRVQWGLARGMKARSWPYAELRQQPIVNDAFAGQPLLVVFDKRTSTTKVFERRTGDRELTFRWQANQLTDEQTSSIWDPITGIAIKGPLEGRRLASVAGVVSLDTVWRSFHPGSETWSAHGV